MSKVGLVSSVGASDLTFEDTGDRTKSGVSEGVKGAELELSEDAGHDVVGRRTGVTAEQ